MSQNIKLFITTARTYILHTQSKYIVLRNFCVLQHFRHGRVASNSELVGITMYNCGTENLGQKWYSPYRRRAGTKEVIERSVDTRSNTVHKITVMVIFLNFSFRNCRLQKLFSVGIQNHNTAPADAR